MLPEIHISGGPTGSTVEIEQDGKKLDGVRRIQLEVEAGGLVAAALFVSPAYLNLTTRLYEVVSENAVNLAKYLAQNLGVPDMDNQIYDLLIAYKVKKDGATN